MDMTSTYVPSLRVNSIDQASESRRQRVELADRLRAPLTVVNGYLSLLANDGLPARDRTQAFAMAIEKCGEMNRVIRQILDNPDHTRPGTGPGFGRPALGLRLRLADADQAPGS